MDRIWFGRPQALLVRKKCPGGLDRIWKGKRLEEAQCFVPGWAALGSDLCVGADEACAHSWGENSGPGYIRTGALPSSSLNRVPCLPQGAALCLCSSETYLGLAE